MTSARSTARTPATSSTSTTAICKIPTASIPTRRATFERVNPAEIEALAARAPAVRGGSRRHRRAHWPDLRRLDRGRRGRAGAGDPRLRTSRRPARPARHAAARRPGAPSDLLRHHRGAARRTAGRGDPLARCSGCRNAREAIDELRRVYSGGIGYDFDQVQIAEERAWLREAVESGYYTAEPARRRRRRSSSSD